MARNDILVEVNQRMTLYELNKLRKSLEPARKLQAKINSKKSLVDSASPNMSGMPPSDGTSKDTIMAAYLDDETELKKIYANIVLSNRKALEYIESIEDEITKLIFIYRFKKNYTWVQVAMELCKKNTGDYTADGVRMQVNRYLEKNL